MASSSPPDVGLDCFYYISVYPGYGVEIKVSDLDPAGGKTGASAGCEGRGGNSGASVGGDLEPGVGDAPKVWLDSGSGSEEATAPPRQRPKLRGAIAYPSSCPRALIKGSGESLRRGL